MVLPHTRRELNWFYGLSFTAGITEEVLYRGFMITYLFSFMPLTSAILLSSALFAGAHGYQGLKGTVRTFTVGLVLATIYALTGSILLAVIAHILVDLIGGRMIYLAYNRSQPTGKG